jgi:WD repeat-containing protein 45
VEMLFRCNLMAIVGGGGTPHAPPHRVLIWDDHIPKEIGELSFKQVVLRVRLRKDAIAVALRDRVYVYHLADLSLRDKIYTADNPHGLLCLSTQIQDMVLACPSVTTGHVRVELYGLRKTVVSRFEHYPLFRSWPKIFLKRSLSISPSLPSLILCSLFFTSYLIDS